MLALKVALMEIKSAPTMIFDEIDTGIGGETAVSIGRSLQSVSECSQVLAITHLPQIAAFASQIINVSKTTKIIDDHPRTISIIDQVTGDKRYDLVKQMNPIL